MHVFALFQSGVAASLLGWALIAGGLALAAHTLAAPAAPGRRVAQSPRAQGPADWEEHQPTLAAAPRLDAAGHWQRLVDIADMRLAQADTVVELHARAAAELQAAEEALRQLLDEWGEGAALAVQPEALAPSGPGSSPLAA
jgi:hypothetical protein